MNRQRKKLPYFIGIGMIVAGLISMIISGQVGESARPYIVFAGVMIFIAGFAGTIIYSTVKDAPAEERKKRPVTRAKVMLWVCGGLCLAGLLALLAGFILFSESNMIVCLIGMAAFVGGGSGMISIFTKHKDEFIESDNNVDDFNEKS